MTKRLLMVEDFPVMQKFYQDALTKAGFEVDIVPDGEEALALTKQKQYNIVLVDMLLPTMSGTDFLEKFVDRPEGVYIAVLSDFTEPMRISRAKELGASDYLVKSEHPPSVLVEKLLSLEKNTSESIEQSPPAEQQPPQAAAV